MYSGAFSIVVYRSGVTEFHDVRIRYNVRSSTIADAVEGAHSGTNKWEGSEAKEGNPKVRNHFGGHPWTTRSKAAQS